MAHPKFCQGDKMPPSLEVYKPRELGADITLRKSFEI